MIAKAGLQDPQTAQALYSDMAQSIVEQLEGRQSPSMVDANSLSTEAVQKLADAAAMIIKANNAAQPKLMEALEIGMIRASGEIKASEQMEVKTGSFSGSTYRFSTREIAHEGSNARMTVHSSEFRDDAQIIVQDALAFEEYSDVVLSALLYREQAWDFGSDYSPVALEVTAYEAMETANGRSMLVKPIEVANLEEPIMLKIPLDSDVPVTCAYMDEAAKQWKALNCPQETFSDSVATCCTTHLSKFALVRTEYLDVIGGNAKAVEVAAFTTMNLVGCLIGVLAVIITMGCFIRQVVIYRSERKLYANVNKQVVDDLHSPEQLETERRQLAEYADDVKPTPRR
jgi:hypothetical protein